MDIKINAEVYCTDGAAGHISRVILDPIDDKLTHIVVKHHGQEHEVEVRHIVSADESEVKLNCSTQYVTTQPNFIETEYIRSPLEHRDMVGDGGYYMPGFYYEPYVTSETYIVKHEHVPLGERAFTRGTHVFAKDGRIGQIDELVVNPTNYHITHVVLREGHLWGQKDVVIGVEHIKDIDAEGVHLKLTKGQVEALPAIPLRRRFGRKAQSEPASR